MPSRVFSSGKLRRKRRLLRSLDKGIIALTLPLLASLLIEPLFIAADTVMIGQLGVEPLAALNIASTVLNTLIGLMIFLAYVTAPQVAKNFGAKRIREAYQLGINGLGFAAVIGIAVGAILAFAHPFFVQAFGPAPAVAQQAGGYLIISAAGVPAMLMVLASTGFYRGVQRTKTIFVVSVCGFSGNIVLNALFIYGFGMGVAGSALGTVLAQWGMVFAYAGLAAPECARLGVRLRVRATGEFASGSAWLFLRTVGLRAAMVLTVAAVTSHGTLPAALFQVVLTLLTFFSFALDAIAMVAQTLVPHWIGAQHPVYAAMVTQRSLWISFWVSCFFAVVLGIGSAHLGWLFSRDESFVTALIPALLVLAAGLPLGAVTFVCDGVLMGLYRGRFLATASLINLACYLPFVWMTVNAEAPPAVLVAYITAAWSFAYMTVRFLLLLFGLRQARQHAHFSRHHT